ncbi:MAG: hypothetical protein JO249_03470 [Acidobacteria bacterium]|nr:hypothetical protein [Acidobacteriota bacterium]
MPVVFRAIVFGLFGFVFVAPAASAQGVPGLDSRGTLPATASPPDGEASTVVPSAIPNQICHRH